MDKQDSIKCLKSMQQWIPDWDDREDGLSYWEALDMAIAALSQPNEPMTLEQLREMDGEPVYCINIDDYSTKEWMIVGKDDCEGRRYIFDFSTYSRNWLAYRRPPEGDEDT